jgi:hypothetical protein
MVYETVLLGIRCAMVGCCRLMVCLTECGNRVLQ